PVTRVATSLEDSNIPCVIDSVLIRYLIPDDCALYIALENDARLKRYVGRVSKRSADDLERQIHLYRSNYGLMAFSYRSTNKYLGRCGCLDQYESSDTEIYVLLGQAAQRQGIGRRLVPFLLALARSRGRRPVAYVDPHNSASIFLMDKLGWLKVGSKQATGR